MGEPLVCDMAPGQRKRISPVDLSQWGPGNPLLCFPTDIGRGFFAWYFPAEDCLEITIKCMFEFVAGSHMALDPDPRDPKNLPLKAPPKNVIVQAPPWEDAEKKAWKAKFMKRCSTYWSGCHAFNCTTKGSESLFAETFVQFVEVHEDDRRGGTYNVQVYRDEHPDFGGGDALATSNVKKNGLVQFDEEAVNRATILHEVGHMLGLGDEYLKDGEAPSAAKHSDLVHDDFGYEVIKGQVDPLRVMCHSDLGGHSMVRDYGVVFAYALRYVTQKTWRFISSSVDEP